MFTTHKLLVVCIFLFCSTGVIAQAQNLKNLDEKNGFNNLKLRLTIDEIRKLVSLKKSTSVKVKDGTMDYYVVKNAEQLYTFGNYKVKSILVGFYNSKVLNFPMLAYIEVNLADTKYLSDSGQLNEMLSKEYGLPTSTVSEDKSFELRQNKVAYVFDWQANAVLLRLIRWNIPVNDKLEFTGNTYKYYDIGILNATSSSNNNGF